MKHLLLIAIIFLTGCGALVPSTSRRSSTTAEAATSSVKSSEQFSKIVSGQQKPAMAQLHVGGLGNKVELKIPQVDQVQPVQVDVRAVGVPRVHDTQPESTAQQPYREEIRYASNVDAADAEKSASKERKDISIPIGVSIGLVGIGMLILLFAVYQTFDGVLAQQIRSIRERAILATDNSTISMLNAQIADLEAQRGRLAR
jgi:hypothetical protein